jgi:hypothetical protein
LPTNSKHKKFQAALPGVEDEYPAPFADWMAAVDAAGLLMTAEDALHLIAICTARDHVSDGDNLRSDAEKAAAALCEMIRMNVKNHLHQPMENQQ